MDRLEKKIRSIVALGVFDGVHRAHQKIFRQVIQRARRTGGGSVVYTFEPHPARVLAPESCPPMIMTARQKEEAIRRAGIQQVLIQKFSRRFARLSPEAFFERVLVKRLKACEIFVGYNFTFGHHRRGTTELLESLGRRAGIRVHVVQPYLFREALVSSTEIRRFLSLGRIDRARELLGHGYQIEGRVVRGRGIGKKTLSIPTANLESENDPILPTGVYATWTEVGKRRHPSVTNIGPNPTFGPGPVSIETHVLGLNRSLLGRRIGIEFVKKIREERVFRSPKDLTDQILKDIQASRRILRRDR